MLILNISIISFGEVIDLNLEITKSDNNIIFNWDTFNVDYYELEVNSVIYSTTSNTYTILNNVSNYDCRLRYSKDGILSDMTY